MLSPDTLVNIETCARRAVWSPEWEPEKLHPTAMLYRAIEQAMCQTEREDAGQFAGEIIMEFAAERGLDVGPNVNRYDCALHHAALADILVTYLKNRYRDGWTATDPITRESVVLSPKSFTDGKGTLVRAILVDHWNEDRQVAEMHSWHTLMPVAVYDQPMSLEVIILGQSKSGRRNSAWSTGFCHPRNHKLRFQKQTDKRGVGAGFADSWRKVWREEVAQISREDWIRAMVDDGMVEQLTKKVTVNPFPRHRREHVVELISQKWLDRRLPLTGELASPSYSGCHSNYRECPFLRCCWAEPERTPSPVEGFLRLR